MPRTAVKVETFYLFNELSDSAKERAREWWRTLEAQDYWFETEDAVTVARILGIRISDHAINMGKGRSPDIYWSHSCSQGDGAMFLGQYFNEKDAPQKIREYAPLDEKLHSIADRLFALQAKHFGLLHCEITRIDHRYCHSGCMDLDLERLDDESGVLASLEFDEATDETINHFHEDGRTMTSLMREFADWIFEQVKADYAAIMADENVDECIRANEYEFTKEGRRA